MIRKITTILATAAFTVLLSSTVFAATAQQNLDAAVKARVDATTAAQNWCAKDVAAHQAVANKAAAIAAAEAAAIAAYDQAAAANQAAYDAAVAAAKAAHENEVAVINATLANELAQIENAKNVAQAAEIQKGNDKAAVALAVANAQIADINAKSKANTVEWAAKNFAVQEAHSVAIAAIAVDTPLVVTQKDYKWAVEEQTRQNVKAVVFCTKATEKAAEAAAAVAPAHAAADAIIAQAKANKAAILPIVKMTLDSEKYYRTVQVPAERDAAKKLAIAADKDLIAKAPACSAAKMAAFVQLHKALDAQKKSMIANYALARALNRAVVYPTAVYNAYDILISTRLALALLYA